MHTPGYDQVKPVPRVEGRTLLSLVFSTQSFYLTDALMIQMARNKHIAKVLHIFPGHNISIQTSINTYTIKK